MTTNGRVCLSVQIESDAKSVNRGSGTYCPTQFNDFSFAIQRLLSTIDQYIVLWKQSALPAIENIFGGCR